MSPEDFEFTARMLRATSGFLLTRDKGYLVENRLTPVLREHGFKSVSELVAALRDGAPALQTAVADAMLPKDTGFFRDWKPFVHFQTTVIPNLLHARATKKSIRILSAGCSTGQEAHSIAMLLRDAARDFAGWKVEILALDLSETAIAAARKGHYSQFDIQRGMPISKLLTYFTKQDDQWVVNPGVGGMSDFKVWNLMEDLYPLGQFDVVLCRNVLNYFDLKTKIEVLQKISRLLVDDGMIYLGLDDAVSGVSEKFHAVNAKQGIYAVRRSGRPVSASLAFKGQDH